MVTLSEIEREGVKVWETESERLGMRVKLEKRDTETEGLMETEVVGLVEVLEQSVGELEKKELGVCAVERVIE